MHRDNIVAFLDAIDAQYGDIKGYLITALGLSEQDITKMQESFLQ